MLSTIILIMVTFLVSVVMWWYGTLAKYKSLGTIPGPTPWPIIGNKIGSTSCELLTTLMKLSKVYGSVFKIWVGPTLQIVITKSQYVEYFLNSTTHLSKSDGYNLLKPWLGDGLLVSTGKKWRDRRKMITPTFHFKILEQFLDTFNNQLNILLDILSKEVENSQKSIDVHHYINLCSLDIICETSFGTQLGSQNDANNEYADAVTTFTDMYMVRFFSMWLRIPLFFRFSRMYPKYKECLEILHGFTNRIIKSRRQEIRSGINGDQSNNDIGIKKRVALLDLLLDVSIADQLSDEDIREEVDTFMFEGHDTIAVSIVFTMYALAKNPDIQNRLYEELVAALGSDGKSEVTYSDLQGLKYLDMVIKESLRMYPPVPLIERKLQENCSLDGIEIPKDTNISIFLYGMCYEEAVFPEPYKFEPERFAPDKQFTRDTYSFVPFSAGPRNCLGQRFALLELKAAIAKLVRYFELIDDLNFSPQLGMTAVLKSKNGIFMYLKQRQ